MLMEKTLGRRHYAQIRPPITKCLAVGLPTPVGPLACRCRKSNIMPAFTAHPILQVAHLQIQIALLGSRAGTGQPCARHLSGHRRVDLLPPVLGCLTQRHSASTFIQIPAVLVDLLERLPTAIRRTEGNGTESGSFTESSQSGACRVSAL
jgi:hypothetical protein